MQCRTEPSVGPLLGEFPVVAEDDRHTRKPHLSLGDPLGEGGAVDVLEGEDLRVPTFDDECGAR